MEIPGPGIAFLGVHLTALFLGLYVILNAFRRIRVASGSFSKLMYFLVEVLGLLLVVYGALKLVGSMLGPPLSEALDVSASVGIISVAIYVYVAICRRLSTFFPEVGVKIPESHAFSSRIVYLLRKAAENCDKKPGCIAFTYGLLESEDLRHKVLARNALPSLKDLKNIVDAHTGIKHEVKTSPTGKIIRLVIGGKDPVVAEILSNYLAGIYKGLLSAIENREFRASVNIVPTDEGFLAEIIIK